MKTAIRWARRFPESANNFDLVLENPEDLDAVQMGELLADILRERSRGLTLSSRAEQEFRRWFEHPETALESDAYVLLSNWITTQAGDRHSTVASRCEYLWDALFPVRPANRLSSPKAGRNHLVIPAEFDRFWQLVVGAQGHDGQESAGERSGLNARPKSRALYAAPAKIPTHDRLRAMFNTKGLHFEVEGPPQALADFLQMVSSWVAPKA